MSQQAFIVRPFGVKSDIDFDKVEEELIQPALKLAGITGSTTAVIMEAGNIREDMFYKLLTADIVVADLSIHNANVFYELGIRHALRDRKTFLIRCSKDEIPFDLKTDRYLSYPAENPAACIANLVSGLRETMLSDKKDSPVFYMLPKLMAQDPECFLAVPPDFGEELEIASNCGHRGKLALLASEAESYAWEVPALRLVGEVQFNLKDFDHAKETWERILAYRPDDIDANDRLATIYQRLAEGFPHGSAQARDLVAMSDVAIKKLLTNYANFDKQKLAEVYSLKGRNYKTRWVNAWKGEVKEEEATAALQSDFLYESYENYLHGFYEDLNHYYSGINALSLLTVITLLAERLPEAWEVRFDNKEDADAQLRSYINEHKKLTVMVEAAIKAEQRRLAADNKEDSWANISHADFTCITLKNPKRVQMLYEQVIQKATDLNFEASKRQLLICRQLNILTENVAAALQAFEHSTALIQKKCNYLLFTGHMIDKEGRGKPRFPNAKKDEVKAAIKEKVQKELAGIRGSVIGIAGGACGGDILFHEVCAESGIHSKLYLALPPELFITESVAFAGAEWIDRFNRLYAKLESKILFQTKSLPHWLRAKKDYNIWERSNLWMLNSALVCGGQHMSLVALWDGKKGDGTGGTDHMLQEAKKRGAKTVVVEVPG